MPWSRCRRRLTSDTTSTSVRASTRKPSSATAHATSCFRQVIFACTSAVLGTSWAMPSSGVILVYIRTYSEGGATHRAEVCGYAPDQPMGEDAFGYGCPGGTSHGAHDQLPNGWIPSGVGLGRVIHAGGAGTWGRAAMPRPWRRVRSRTGSSSTCPWRARALCPHNRPLLRPCPARPLRPSQLQRSDPGAACRTFAA